MTDKYNAGEIVITTSIDTSTLTRQLDASRNKLVDKGFALGHEFGKSILSGFDAGHTGKQAQDGFVKGIEGVIKDAADVGEKAGEGFANAEGEMLRRIRRRTKKASKKHYLSLGSLQRIFFVIHIGDVIVINSLRTFLAHKENLWLVMCVLPLSNNSACSTLSVGGAR